MGVYIYLKVAKVGTQNQDLTTSIERNDISLEKGKNFNSFVELLHVQNFLMSDAEKPRIVKVVKNIEGKEVEFPEANAEMKAAQKQVDVKLESMKMSVGEVDHKALSEKLTNQNKEIQAQNAALADRLAALEAKINAPQQDENPLHIKAKELNIDFRSDIGDEKLIARIQEVDKNFKA